MGKIPKLTFVKDPSQARYLEVERVLETADFGPDYQPTTQVVSSAIRQLPTANVSVNFQFLEYEFLIETTNYDEDFELTLVRRSGRGLVSWTCDPLLALGQRFDSHCQCLIILLQSPWLRD